MNHPVGRPLPFVVEQAGALAPGRALDVACGQGRHLAWLADRGWAVTGLDADPAALAVAAQRAPGARLIERDVEAHGLLPDDTAAYDLVVVTYFLHRPLFVDVARVLAPGGVLLCETFHEQNRAKRDRPRRAHFALAAGEGRALCQAAGLTVTLSDEGERGDVYTTRVRAEAG